MATTSGAIRVGIGGWTYEPWRGGTFYPEGLAQKRELEHASRRLTSIEINGTYYGAQKPESFARWREETPEGFIFALKGPRFATNRRALAEAGASVERFVTGGLVELGDKLGPINWQLLPTKAFDPADFEAFLKLLPSSHEGRALRHVVEVRHDSFRVPEFVELLRAYGIAAVLTDKPGFPEIADVTAPFVYLRLQAASEAEPEGYAATELDRWAARLRAWAGGAVPEDPQPVGTPPAGQAAPREVFCYFINGFKPKAPAAAEALITRLGGVGG